MRKVKPITSLRAAQAQGWLAGEGAGHLPVPLLCPPAPSGVHLPAWPAAFQGAAHNRTGASLLVLGLELWKEGEPRE